MTPSISDKLSEKIAVRPRVALALAAASRTIPALCRHRDATRIVQEALADGWRWELGADRRASDLYDQHVEGLGVQGSLIAEREPCSAMNAAIAAFYFMMWHAFDNDLALGLVRAGDISNDMAEVDEQVLDEVCDCALQTSLCDHHWITQTADRLLADFSTDRPSDLGPSVEPAYFEQKSP